MNELKTQLQQLNINNSGLTSNIKNITNSSNSLKTHNQNILKQNATLKTQLQGHMTNKTKLDTQLSNENIAFDKINNKHDESVRYQTNLKGMMNNINYINSHSDNLGQSRSIKDSSGQLQKLYDTSLHPDLDILNIRKRMLYISKEKNKYKRKIIYTQIAILILLILFIVGLYNINNK